MAERRPHVVVIGAGFGGLAAARELAGVPVDITIVDRHNFHTFQPLLYQVATAGLNAADIAYAVRGIFHRQPNVAFRLGAVERVDWSTRTLYVDEPSEPIVFDYLVVAAGATTNFFGVKGAEEHTFPLYALADAVRLRNHILERFEAADADPALVDDGALTVVVVGGGATGVEVAGALSELFDVVMRKDFRTLDVSRARVIVVEMAEHLLAPFDPPSQRHALATLRDRGVDVRLGATVAAATPTRVVLQSGEEIAAHTIVWAAGVQANPLVARLGVPTTRGRIDVTDALRIVGHANAFAVGDVAAITDRRRGVLPQLAPVAMQSGRHAGREIRRAIDARPMKPFHYHDKGTMATIGRRAAVAELPGGLHLKGTPAWLAWLGLHLFYLIGFRNRLSVLMNWGWNYLTWDRGPRLIFSGGRPDAPPATRPEVPTTRR